MNETTVFRILGAIAFVGVIIISLILGMEMALTLFVCSSLFLMVVIPADKRIEYRAKENLPTEVGIGSFVASVASIVYFLL